MKVDPRFLTGQGPEIFTGNQLLVKGALEAEGGVHLLGGYPGSPIAEFFDTLSGLRDLLNEKGIRAVINNNEALAAAMLNGTQLTGCRAMIGMKSVGVHVAADALALGNLSGANPDGGAIIIYGDDPWSDSTQVPADTRYISKHLHIPVIEPSDAQEVKDWVDLSFKLSRMAELYAGYLVTTNLADGGGTVVCRPNQYPALNTRQRTTLDTAAIDLDTRVLLPPKTWWQEEALTPRFARAVLAARQLGLNRILYPAGGNGGRKPLGFVTSGLAHAYLLQSLLELGILGEHPILKFGMSYPIDAELVGQFATQCERIIVIEERRGFLQEQIAEVMLERRQKGQSFADVWGKEFPGGLKGMPATRGLHPSIIIARLVPLLKSVHGSPGRLTVPAGAENWDRELATIAQTDQLEVGQLIGRTPTFCPGCPHRDTADLCLEIKRRFMDADYMRRRHKRGAMDLMFHGDTGCYTMLMFPPTTPLMHDYSGMGLGGGTGSGIDPFINNKQVVFMGDSTFFHSGQIGISQAVKLGQDITFIVLDNRTTAMTGHQCTPGLEYDVLGNPTPAQDIEEIIRGITAPAGVPVFRVDPERRKEYAELLEETFLADGVKVIIADKECGITRMRRRRREERDTARQKGFLPVWEHMNINADICRFCLTCAEMTGCPGLRHVATDYGRKMDTDISWCVNDGACERLRACSAFEHVTIRRKRPPRSRAPELGLDNIPDPPRKHAGDVWRCALVGVGGMGIGVATSILVRAGHKEGYPVIFLDKKGLAIRNGSVVSQVVYNVSNQPITGIIPYGKADLLIGVDLLEAARALDPNGRTRIASPDRTAAVVNTDKVQTIRGTMGLEDFDTEALEAIVRQNTRSDDFLARNIARICEKYLGNKLYANIMMLGFAFQKGLIPVSMHSMAWAIKDTIHADFRKNLYAFNMGRKLVLDRDLFQGPPVRHDWRDVLEEKCRWTIRRYGRRGHGMADRLRELTAATVDAMGALAEPLKLSAVVRIYDCMRWGGLAYARRYADEVLSVYAKDSAAHGYAATRAVIHNLAGAMLVKDGFFMAELAASPEKRARDREKYNVNRSNGDRIVYRHLLHPEITIGRRTFRPDIAVSTPTMKVLRSLRRLRGLMPGWHREEQSFLRQYRRKVTAFRWTSPKQYEEQLAALSSPRCMACAMPRCQEAGCPLKSPVSRWTLLAGQERWQEAAEALHQANNFPEFTSRICPGFCQEQCKQAIDGYAVQARCIERQIIDKAFAEGWVLPRTAANKTGRKVAVIGSGPAGLAAAQQLLRAGHDVTLFEKDAALGGVLRYGVPQFRLDKRLIDRRLEQLTAEGLQVKAGTRVGRDMPADELRKQFDAVLLATGAARPRDLEVPGRDLAGVYLAMDYLRSMGVPPMSSTAVSAVNGTQQTVGCAGSGPQAQVLHTETPAVPSAKGKVVAVIGGGLTGEDCVETALLQGAKEVHQFEILPQPKDAKASKGGNGGGTAGSAVVRRWCVATRGFTGDNGGLRELAAVEVRWVRSADGLTMKEVPESSFRVRADMALLAMGFDAAVDPRLARQLDLACDERGRCVVTDYATSAPGVFIAGDATAGPAYLAAAINSGRKAAERIDAFLTQP